MFTPGQIFFNHNSSEFNMLSIWINTWTTLCHDWHKKCHHVECYHFQGTDFHTKVSFGTDFYWWDLVIHTEHMFCTGFHYLIFACSKYVLLNIHFCTDPPPMAVPHQLVTFWPSLKIVHNYTRGLQIYRQDTAHNGMYFVWALETII